MHAPEIELLHRLRSQERIFEILKESNATELALQKMLRDDFPVDVVRAALTLADLRARAAKKFSRADRMWFSRVGLEQSTAEPVARWKAKRFAQRERPVWDLCCGAGGDAIALTESSRVAAVDASPAACLRTRWNAEVYGVEDSIDAVCADVKSEFLSADASASLVHIDPDRRSGRAKLSGRRTLRVEDVEPGLSFLRTLPDRFRGGAIKLSPASNFGGKFDDVEIELISLDGECKEATVWFGEPAAPGLWRATSLPSGESIAGDPLDAVADVSPVEGWVFDPDPALVRAGLVDVFADLQGLSRLDDAEEYLTGCATVSSPFVRGFEVVANLPNNQRELRKYFRNANFGRVEIKCRHIPVDAESVRRRLPLEGDDPAVLIIARIEGRARALVCRAP